MSVDEAVARLREALDCPDGEIVHKCWVARRCSREEFGLDNSIKTVLDELERLRTENKWLRLHGVSPWDTVIEAVRLPYRDEEDE